MAATEPIHRNASRKNSSQVMEIPLYLVISTAKVKPKILVPVGNTGPRPSGFPDVSFLYGSLSEISSFGHAPLIENVISG